jgi:hypothetical protein
LTCSTWPFSALTVFLFLSISAAAQTTVVSGTVVDPNGWPYAGAIISASLVPAGVTTPHIGSWQIQAGYGPYSLDANGSFAFALPDNLLISPAGTQWQFIISFRPVGPPPGGGGPTASYAVPLGSGPQTCSATVTITGASQSISGSFTCPVILYPCKVGVSCGGGAGGCSVTSLLNTWVLSIHPNATCYGSVDWTWDDGASAHNMQAGDGTNSITNGQRQFIEGNGNAHTDAQAAWTRGELNTLTGDSNTLGNNFRDTWIHGTQNTIRATGASTSLNTVFEYGYLNAVQALTGATLSGVMCLMKGCGLTVNADTSAHVDTIFSVGTQGAFSASGALSNTSSIFSIGESNSAFSHAGTNTQDTFLLGEHNSAQTNNSGAFLDAALELGFNQTLAATTTGSPSATYLFEFGHLDTIQTSTGSLNEDMTIGYNHTMTDCSNCYLFGQNGNVTNANSGLGFIGIGLSPTPELQVTPGNVRRSTGIFSSLPACSGATEGSIGAITDSTTNTWGATITGGGTDHVLGYCDGTNWTVAAL